MIAQLGYVPDHAARQLVTRRNTAVAVVATQPQDRLFIDPFFDRHLRGIRKELVAHGVQPVLLFWRSRTTVRASPTSWAAAMSTEPCRSPCAPTTHCPR